MTKYCFGCYRILNKKEYDRWKSHPVGGFFNSSAVMPNSFRGSCCSKTMKELIGD